MMRPLTLWLWPLALLLGLSACSAPRVETQADLESRIDRDPRDAEALRDLGAMLARQGETAGARDALELAAAIRPADGETLYLLGLATEALDARDDAEAIYARYNVVPAADTYRDSLRARLNGLVRSRLRVEMARSIASEDTLAAVASDAVGVLPFAYRGADETYRPLGRGLAEVLSVDLASIEGLTVVERARLAALLAEYELARRGVLDAATAPRTGRLLQADRLVGGEYDVRDNQLRIDAAVWQDDSVSVDVNEGGLADLFDLQRETTQTVLVALGIAPAAVAQLGDPPTTDIEAFLLFSRGLLEEDRGSYAAASRFYEQAVARDPSFELAATRLEESGASESASGAAGSVLRFAARPSVPEDPLDLVGRRADAIRTHLGIVLGPSDDSREPVVEGSQSGVLGALPDPPPPPAPPPSGGN